MTCKMRHSSLITAHTPIFSRNDMAPGAREAENARLHHLLAQLALDFGHKALNARNAEPPHGLPPYRGHDFGNIAQKQSGDELQQQMNTVRIGLSGRVDSHAYCYGVDGKTCVGYIAPNTPHVEDEVEARRVVVHRHADGGGWCNACNEELKNIQMVCKGLRFSMNGTVEQVIVKCSAAEDGGRGDGGVVQTPRYAVCGACVQLHRHMVSIKRAGPRVRESIPSHGNLSVKNGQIVDEVEHVWSRCVVHKNIAKHYRDVDVQPKPTKPHDLFFQCRQLRCYVCGRTSSATTHCNTGDLASEEGRNANISEAFGIVIHPQCCVFVRTTVEKHLLEQPEMSDEELLGALISACEVRQIEISPETAREWMLLRSERSAFYSTRRSTGASGNIVTDYAIPSREACRVVFNFVRTSGVNYDTPKTHMWTPNDAAYLASKVFKDDGTEVVAGTGRVYVVPDRYLKQGAAKNSLFPSDKPLNVAGHANSRARGPQKMAPDIVALLGDIIQVLETNTQAQVSILVDAPITLGGDVQHLLYALSFVPSALRTRLWLTSKSSQLSRERRHADESLAGTAARMTANFRPIDATVECAKYGVLTVSCSNLVDTLKLAPAKLDHVDRSCGRFLEALYDAQYQALLRGENHSRHVNIATQMNDSQAEGLLSQSKARSVRVSGQVIHEGNLAQVEREIFLLTLNEAPIRCLHRVQRQRKFFSLDQLEQVKRRRVDRWMLESGQYDPNQPDDEGTLPIEAREVLEHSDDDEANDVDDDQLETRADAEPPVYHAAPIMETIDDFAPVETGDWELDDAERAALTETLSQERCANDHHHHRQQQQPPQQQP